MNPTDHNGEDVLRGVRAIARALRTRRHRIAEQSVTQARQALENYLQAARRTAENVEQGSDSCAPRLAETPFKRR